MKLNIIQAVNKVGMKVSKHSPLILTGVAVVGLGVTAVFAYKAAKRVETITDELEEAREVEERIVDLEEVESTSGLSEDEYIELETLKQVPVISRSKVTRDVIGAVALPVVTGAVSITCMLYSYKILNSRNGALAATVGTLMAEHRAYRERVRTVAGEETYEKVNQPYDPSGTKGTVMEDGKEKEIDLNDPVNRRSLIGEWFFNSEEYVADDHMYNEAFVRDAISRLEVRLFGKGVLRLNEVYDTMGLARTRAGELMGWHAGDMFMDTTVTLDRGNVPQIYINWSEPKYIYDSVSYDTANWGA